MRFSINICCLLLCSILFFNACSVSKEFRKNRRLAKENGRLLSGSWVLQTVVIEGTNSKPKDKVFNEADFGCFIGSEWKFKRYGSYTLVDKTQGCPQISRKFRWSSFPPTENPEMKYILAVKRYLGRIVVSAS